MYPFTDLLMAFVVGFWTTPLLLVLWGWITKYGLVVMNQTEMNKWCGGKQKRR